MKVCVPHMHTAYVPIRALLSGLGVEMVVPPFNSRRTLSLGTRYSPEFVCTPYKLLVGNFIEGLEMGADTLVMIEGNRICRLGYYMKVMEGTLRDLGYDFRLITTRIFERGLWGLPAALRIFQPEASLGQMVGAIRMALTKLAALDEVERVVQRVRARELAKGQADRAWSAAIEAIDRAADPEAIRQAKESAIARLEAIPQDTEVEPLRVCTIGEIYVVLEPFINMDVERELGRLGVEVHRSIMISNWTKFALFLSAFGKGQHDEVHAAAMPYLKRDVGGDGWESVGEVVVRHEEGFDGMVHLTPFTCMPEVIAQNIFPALKAKHDIPVLTITCDEQMGKAGMVTRLEAFVDLMRRRALTKNVKRKT